jgi:hypothetical protein
MSPLAGFCLPIILPAAARSKPFDATYLQAPVTATRYVEHHLFERPAPSGKAHVQGIRIGVEVNGQPMLLTGMGNGPIDAASHAPQAVGIQVQVRSYEERSTRASSNAGDAQACAFLELVCAARWPGALWCWLGLRWWSVKRPKRLEESASLTRWDMHGKISITSYAPGWRRRLIYPHAGVIQTFGKIRPAVSYDITSGRIRWSGIGRIRRVNC